jgi:Zn-dependent peptidase ImmA (M78 family)
VSTWERFAGDTARFAVRLSFEPDPDKDVFDDPAYSGSWGSLRIWVDGLDVCAHTVGGESDESVHWYLLPLVEWLAEHWDPILHEERLPVVDRFATAAEAMTVEPPLPIGVDDERHYAALDEWQAWWRRHALESAADGGLFPRIFFRRWGDQIEVSWRSDGLVGAPEGLRFAAPLGRAQYPAGEVARALYEVATGAAAELVRRHPTSERAAASRDALRAVAQGDRVSGRLRWLVGLTAERAAGIWTQAGRLLESTAQRTRDALLNPVSGDLVIEGSPHLVALFGSVAPDVSAEDVTTLTGLMLDFYADESAAAGPEEDENDLWRGFHTALSDIADIAASTLPDYEQGNRLAQFACVELDVDDERPVDVRAILNQLAVRVQDIELSDGGIRGISLAGPGHRPACLINVSYQFGRSEQIKRFTLAHELCHLLFDRWRARRLAVASGPWAPQDIERRANAFAAAFLLPRSLLDRAAHEVDAPYASVDWVVRMAAIANTSALATLERLANLGILPEFKRDALRYELLRRSADV